MSIPRSRRRFLIEIASGTIGAYLIAGLTACRRVGSRAIQPPSAQRRPLPVPRDLRALSLLGYFTVAAASERILPRDESPGAIDLDVPRYIDRALAAQPHGPWQTDFSAGLDDLDSEARAKHQASFHRLSAELQDKMLAQWENDQSELEAESRRARFFRKLVRATLEGAFAVPLYGGNKEGRGWTLLGARRDPFVPTALAGEWKS